MSFAVVDPATGQTIETLEDGDAAAAVAAAAAAFPGWSARPAEERRALVAQAGERLAAHFDELVALDARETGKPLELAAAMGEVASTFAAYAAMETPEREDVLRVPFGVAALIVPWNFPLPIAADSLPPLLVTGNTVVLKPSELAPLACARAVALIEDLVPVFLLHGGPAVGRALVADERVDIVVFTGSERTGREIGEVCGRRLVPALLELGGKDPVVVDAGVDPEWAADLVATGAFTHTGQICTSMERIYVHRDVAEPFVAALVRRAREQRLGPLISERQREIVERHVADAVAGGAEVLVGGVAGEGDGYFFPATVLTGVRDDMAVMREETFGPLAPVAVVDSFDEGVARAADSSYGLGATVLTPDDARAAEAARRIPAGIVWVNGWQMYGEDPVYEPARASGVGKVGGSAMLEAVTRPQHVARAPR